MSYAVDESWGDYEPQMEERRSAGSGLDYRRLRLKKSDKGTALQNYSLGEFVVFNKQNPQSSFFEGQFVPLQINVGRRLQSPYVPGQQRKTHCESNDRIAPITYGEFTPKSHDCKSCSYGELAWARYNETQDRIDLPNNPCEENAELVLVDFNNPKEIITYFGDRERYQFEQLLTNLRAEAKRIKEQHGIMPKLYQFVVSLKSGRNRKGNTIPYVDYQGLMSNEDVPAFADLYERHKKARTEWRSKKIIEVEQKRQAQQLDQAATAPQRFVQQPAQHQAQRQYVQQPVQQQQQTTQYAQQSGVNVQRVATIQRQPVQQTQQVQQVQHASAYEETRAYDPNELRQAAGLPTQQQTPQGAPRFTPPVSSRVVGSRPTYNPQAQAPVQQVQTPAEVSRQYVEQSSLVQLDPTQYDPSFDGSGYADEFQP